MADAGGLADSVAAFIPFQTKQAQDVLAHPEIKALAARFPDQAERLRDCVEGLSSHGPAETETLVQATKKAFDAVPVSFASSSAISARSIEKSRSC
jgi:hypothetical protein